MNQYAILFVGTPFMDGKYTRMEAAYEVKEHLTKKYPGHRLEIIKVSDRFDLSVDIFWANHKEKIEQFEKD